MSSMSVTEAPQVQPTVDRGSVEEERSRPTVGDEVLARDGVVGRVVEMLRTESDVPRYMIVATGRLRRRYPVIDCDLITRIDAEVVRVRGSRRVLVRFPESLPIVV
jgi:hypothetical protein